MLPGHHHLAHGLVSAFTAGQFNWAEILRDNRNISRITGSFFCIILDVFGFCGKHSIMITQPAANSRPTPVLVPFLTRRTTAGNVSPKLNKMIIVSRNFTPGPCKIMLKTNAKKPEMLKNVVNRHIF